MGGAGKWLFLLTFSTDSVYAEIVGGSEKVQKYADGMVLKLNLMRAKSIASQKIVCMFPVN